VVVNDFGDINIDAGLVSGQVDEPASIAGGCICCLSDDTELDAALTRLADPRLRLDAIIIEASGLADPVSLARMVGFSEVAGVRDGGVIDVIDAATHFELVDDGGVPPARYGAATLVVVNKLDRIPEPDRAGVLKRIEERVRQRNPRAQIVGAVNGRIDSTLLYDVASAQDEFGQLSFRDALFETGTEADTEHHHVHADSVTVASEGDIDPLALVELLEDPPAGVYRLKGTVAIRQRSSTRLFVVNVVGSAVHVTRAPTRRSPSSLAETPNGLVAIGMHLDTDTVRARLSRALRSTTAPPSPAAARRLQRYLRR